MNELDKLIDAVEGGDPNVWTFYEALPREIYDRGFQAYHGSLDAVKSLHEALLPDMLWSISPLGKVQVLDKSFNIISESGYKHSVARSGLIAIIKAYRAQQEMEQ